MVAGSEASPSAQVDGRLDAALVRRWLGYLRRPEKLADAELVDLLERRGLMPAQHTAKAIGAAGAALINEAIDRLAPPPGADRDEALAHQVLVLCFRDGLKAFQAANRIGISERQISRERAWAIELLTQELGSTAVGGEEEEAPYHPEPIPVIESYVPRPAVEERLARALATDRMVKVTGPPGIGKSTMVAEVAQAALIDAEVLWFRVRRGLTDSLAALLFELGDHLAATGSKELAQYLQQSLPTPDLAVASRLALRGLERPQLVVVDDYHLVADDAAVGSFLDEAVTRLPSIRVVLITRHQDRGARRGSWFSVPTFTRAESKHLLERLGVRLSAELLDRLQEWTNGTPQLLHFAASWLRTASEEEVAQGIESLSNRSQVNDFLLETLTELLDPDDREVLAAASVFRDRFSDAALAAVSGRTLGAVADASIRLVRVHAAVRARDGQTAFFHGTVRQYVYDRLSEERRRELHQRAAGYYEEQGEPDEAEYHRRLHQDAGFVERVVTPSTSRSRSRAPASRGRSTSSS